MSNSTSTENQSAQESSELSLLDQVMQETRIQPGDDGFDTARRGVEEPRNRSRTTRRTR